MKEKYLVDGTTIYDEPLSGREQTTGTGLSRKKKKFKNLEKKLEKLNWTLIKYVCSFNCLCFGGRAILKIGWLILLHMEIGIREKIYKKDSVAILGFIDGLLFGGRVKLDNDTLIFQSLVVEF